MSKARQLADLGNVYDDGALSNRNVIVNGAMTIAQRAASVTGVTSNGYFICDRWYFDSSGSSATYSLDQSSDAPDGFAYSFKATATTALASPASGDARFLTYRFEGQDLQQLNFAKSSAKKVTVSFWVKASTTGTAVLGMYQDDGALYYGKQYTVNSANTWEYKTLVVDLPTSGTVIANDNTAGLRIYFALYSGSSYASGSTETWGDITNWFVGQDNFSASTNDTFQITGVQLEVGDTATPFEHRSYGDELARCQRYYYKIGGETSRTGFATSAAHTTSAAYGIMHYPVTMRSAPTVSLSNVNGDYYITGNNTNQNITAFGVEGANKYSSTLNVNGSFSQGSAYWFNSNTASASIRFDAEL